MNNTYLDELAEFSYRLFPGQFILTWEIRHIMVNDSTRYKSVPSVVRPLLFDLPISAQPIFLDYIQPSEHILQVFNPRPGMMVMRPIVVLATELAGLNLPDIDSRPSSR